MDDINKLLGQGVSLLLIAKLADVSYFPLWRHANGKPGRPLTQEEKDRIKQLAMGLEMGRAK